MAAAWVTDMRKTSAYARRMRRAPDGGTFNGAEWLNTFQRCRNYTDEPIPGSFNADGGQTVTAARGAALRVRAAFRYTAEMRLYSRLREFSISLRCKYTHANTYILWPPNH